MKRLLFIVSILMIAKSSVGQVTVNDSDKSKTIIHDFSYKKKWEYFTLDDTISGTIIEYNRARMECGVLATAAMTILKTENQDTIRVISLCYTTDKFKAGQNVRVKPFSEPSFGVTLPFTMVWNEKTELYEPTFYDLNVFKTTYGGLIE